MAFEAFQERDYRLFWTSQFFSNIGSWMQAVAQGWLVYHLTDSPFLLGFVGFANSLPTIFLMLPGGVVADSYDRRRVISASQWAQALCALFLALSIRTHQISTWQIIAAAIVVGIAVSFSAPAYQAMVVDLLDDRARLPNAVAMNSLQFNLSRAIGPLLAGVTLSAYGSFWCFFFNAISFLPLIWVLGRLQDRQHLSERAAMVVSVALCNTSIQRRVPDAMRGRVLSMYTFAFYAFLPFGNLVAGLIAEHRGLPMTMFTLGGGLIVSAGIAWVAILVERSRRH